MAASTIPPLLVLLGLAAPQTTAPQDRAAVVEALSRRDVRQRLQELSPRRGDVRVEIASVLCGEGGTGTEVRFLACADDRCEATPIDRMTLRCVEPEGVTRIARR